LPLLKFQPSYIFRDIKRQNKFTPLVVLIICATAQKYSHVQHVAGFALEVRELHTLRFLVLFRGEVAVCRQAVMSIEYSLML